MKRILKQCRTSIGALTLATASIGLPMTAHSSGVDEGVVLSVHSAKASAQFEASRGLPSGQVSGGRYAVVKLVDGPWGDASFALVYVPPQLVLQENDHVALEPAASNILAHPGTGVVSHIVEQVAASH
jgi:hypothetical protein